LKDDFKNFMQMKYKQMPQSARDDCSSNLAYSARLMKSQVTPGSLKPIFESSYVPPDKNPSVIQDNDPIKQQAMLEALRRYHDVLAEKQKSNEQHI